jgi:hypothetical protein
VYADQFGSSGGGNGQFMELFAMTINSTHIFVGDYTTKRVQILDHAGNYQDDIYITNRGSGYHYIRGITINGTHIFVSVDFIGFPNKQQIEVLDLGGNSKTTIGDHPGTGDGEFDSPSGIAVSGSKIFTVNKLNNRLQIFDLAGNFISSFGGFGTTNGQFNYPEGIAINSTHLFVTDYHNHRVQIFDHAGTFEAKFGYLGAEDGNFSGPTSIAVSEDHILVSEYYNDRIQVFGLSGNYITKFGDLGSGNGQFINPRDIVSNYTHVFVADEGNDRVQIFAYENFPPQNLSTQFGISSITLFWDAPIPYLNYNLTGYRIYRGTQQEIYSFMYDTEQLYFQDFAVEENQTYYYVITAVYTDGESRYSNEASGQVPIQQTVTRTETVTDTEILVSTTIFDTTTETTTKTEESHFPWYGFLILIPIITIINKRRRRN